MSDRLHGTVRALALGACALLLLGCVSGTNPPETQGDPNATAPAASTDPDTRYLPSSDPIGAIPVETAPVDGTWTSGQTSIARPAPGTATGSPDAPLRPGAPAGSPGAAAGSPDGGLAAPGVRRTPVPPPPPLR